MPVFAVVVLLRTVRAALERTSKMSRFPSMAYCTAIKKDTGPRSLDCSSATSTRDKDEHSVVKQSRAHEHSAAAAVAPSGSRVTLGSSNTRTPLPPVGILLRTARAALDRTSMNRFPSIAYIYLRKRKGHGTTITRLLKRNEHETNTSTAWPSSHGHTSTQQQQQQQQQQ